MLNSQDNHDTVLLRPRRRRIPPGKGSPTVTCSLPAVKLCPQDSLDSRRHLALHMCQEHTRRIQFRQHPRKSTPLCKCSGLRPGCLLELLNFHQGKAGKPPRWLILSCFGRCFLDTCGSQLAVRQAHRRSPGGNGIVRLSDAYVHHTQTHTYTHIHTSMHARTRAHTQT